MGNNRVSFAGLKLELPKGWFDITDELEPNSPFTLGRSDDAVGALQFSVARYKDGKPPEISLKKLREMLTRFFNQNDFGTVTNMMDWTDSVTYVCGDHIVGDIFYRIWYVTDSKNIALVTYTTEQKSDSNFASEIVEAEEIVKSISF